MVINFTLILSICTLVQLAYWLLIFNRLGDYSSIKTSETTQFPMAVSIIICVNKFDPKTESNFKMVLSQEYANYNVLIVNNGNDRKLQVLLYKLESKYMHLKVLNSPQDSGSGKKQALKQALKHIKNTPVLLTDADCIPASKKWLIIMVNEMRFSNSDIVLGYSPYVIVKKSLLNQWIHYEGFYSGLQYLSFAIAKMPYMGVGRNLLYKSNTLNEEILEKHQDLVSGDDDLSVNELSKDKSVGICLDPQSFVYTFPKNSWFSYFNQKRRHYSTSHRYNSRELLHLMLLSGSHFFFYMTIFILLVQKVFLICATLYLIRIFLILPIVIKVKNKLCAKISVVEFMILDFVHVIYYMIFAYSVLFPQKHKW